MSDFVQVDRVVDPALVRQILDAVGNQFITVTFVKKDGTERTVNGQLRATSRLANGGGGASRLRERGQVWIALRDKTSRSFYVDRVVGLKAGGREVRV